MKTVYSCVARGSTVLCAYQTGPGPTSYELEVQSILKQRITKRKFGKNTYRTDNYRFYCLIRKGIVYMCASHPESERKQCFDFLTEVKRRFLATNLVPKVADANPHQFDRKLRQPLSELTRQYFNVGPSISVLKAELEEVRYCVGRNLDRLIERGENIDYLTEKADHLEASAETFQVIGRRLRKKYFCQYHQKLICFLLLGLIVCGAVVVVLLFVTGVLKWPEKGSASNQDNVTATSALS